MCAVRSKTRNRSRTEELRDLRAEIKNLRNGLRNLEAGLQRENDCLRAALAPFAKAADSREEADEHGITLVDLRRAKAALAASASRVLARAGAKTAKSAQAIENKR